MRKAKPKQKKIKKSHQQYNLNKTNENVTKFVGNFNGFQIYDKIDNNDTYLTFQMNEDPELKDWIFIQHNSNKTESRFTNLFQEILENDIKLEKKNEIIINDEKSFEENLLPNNFIDDIDDYDDEDFFKNKKNLIYNDNIDNIEDKMNKININNNNLIKNDNNIFINSNNKNIIINKENSINNKFLNSLNKENNLLNNNQNININNNNFAKNNINNYQNIINFNKIPNNNNIINNNKLLINYNPNLNIKNNNINNINAYNIYPEQKMKDFRKSIKSNSNNHSNNTTAPSSMERTSSLFSFLSNSSGVNNNNKNDYFYFPSKNSINEQSPPRSEKKYDINIDIKKIIYLEDRRTTLMIKNIPNKFNRDLILNLINKNFEGAYDLFVMQTDSNGNKNFGYSFINFTSNYYIPYFYHLFNNKNWPNTNSKKVCEITYSKIQGRNNLISHYPNKYIYKNDLVNKNEIKEQKYKIPYKYSSLFFKAYPNYTIEKCDNYFLTKMPFRY